MAHNILVNRSARCLNSGCGKESLRDSLAETPARFRQRESDTAERQHQLKVDKLRAEATETHRRVANLQRDRLLGKVADIDLIERAISEGDDISEPDASRHNRSEIAAYCREHPEVEWTPELSTLVGRYFYSNGLTRASRRMIATAVAQMQEAGLVPEQTKPVVKPVTVTPPPATVEPAKAKKEPEELTGYDPETGRAKTYTRLEVDKMSADQYRRTFRVTKADLTLPNHVVW